MGVAGYLVYQIDLLFLLTRSIASNRDPEVIISCHVSRSLYSIAHTVIVNASIHNQPSRSSHILRSGMRAAANASRRLKAIAIRSTQWPSLPTRPGSRRRHATRQSRSGIRAAATASRRLKAIAIRSRQWPSLPTRPGWRRCRTTRQSRSGTRAAATASRRLVLARHSTASLLILLARVFIPKLALLTSFLRRRHF